MKMKTAGMAGVMMVMAGCCHAGPVKPLVGRGGALPAALSLEAQLQILNSRAEALPRMRAKGTVVLRYVDEQGNAKQDSADGTLLLRQRYGAEAARDPADVALWGRVAGQEIFQAAKNQEKWWFIRRDMKVGWMGNVEGTPDLSGSYSGGVMRADLMLQVLAITEILPHPGETIFMKVHDASRTNEIGIAQLRGDGTAWIKREIIVDRDSGEVRQVTLGDPSGKLAVRAELKNYQAVGAAAGDAAPGKTARFPRDIRIIYPAQKLDIHFTVDDAVLLTAIPDAAFVTPDFSEQGIQEGNAGSK